MQFAKRLDHEAVAEWKPKYLQYKQLKKLVMLIAEERGTVNAGGHNLDLEQFGKYSKDEVIFFQRFDGELEKIESFYMQRLENAISKKFKIMQQLHILPAINKKKRKGKRGRGLAEGKDLMSETGPEMSNLLTWKSNEVESPTLMNGNKLLNDSQVNEALNLMSIKSNEMEETPAHLKIDSLRRAPFSSLAKQRIKKALLEFYRSLELLRNFKTLNKLACYKILKKFDKYSGRRSQNEYREKLEGYKFISSNVVDSLMNDVENIYRWVFTGGDRSKALRKLRIKDIKSKNFHGSAMIAGILLGICMLLTFKLFSLVLSSTDHVTRMLGYIYFGFGLAVFMSILFAINAEVYDIYSINYRFILEFNQRNNLHVCQYTSLAAIFAIFYLCLVYVSLSGILNEWVLPMLQPWCVLASMFGILMCPFNFLYRSSRIWFARVIVRIATAPFYPCRFKDFFINDQYMSLGISFECLGLLIYFTLNPAPSKFNVHIHAWYIVALKMVPGFHRVMQCIRRYRDSKMAFPHLANLAKYLCSLLVVFTSGLSSWATSGENFFFYTIIIEKLVSACFSLTWDIVMDFGLLQRGPANDRLRDTILFKPSVYYYLIFADTVARFMWTLPYLNKHLGSGFANPLALTLALCVVEVLRRFQWNFFRVEYEHVNNCNALRATSDVPLPFTATDLFYQDMVETLEKQKSKEDPDESHCEESEVETPTTVTSGGSSPHSSGCDINVDCDSDHDENNVCEELDIEEEYDEKRMDSVLKSANIPSEMTMEKIGDIDSIDSNVNTNKKSQ